MVLASDGSVYGATDGRGVGSLFRVTTAGVFETLYSFVNGYVGLCVCYLTEGSNGLFYGTSQSGEGSGVGTVWVWDLGLPKPVPILRGLLPASGVVGSSVILYGSNVLAATSVTFNDVPAMVFGNISASYVSATVPVGATTGPVTITMPNGSSTSPAPFTVE